MTKTRGKIRKNIKYNFKKIIIHYSIQVIHWFLMIKVVRQWVETEVTETTEKGRVYNWH